MRERQLLRDMFDAVVAVASAEKAVPPKPPPPTGRTVVVGAPAMARAVGVSWPADTPLTGLVVMRYGHGAGPLKRIEVAEAAHPDPDLAGQIAAARLLDLVQGLGLEDLALCLVSGGGSALLWLPAAWARRRTSRRGTSCSCEAARAESASTFGAALAVALRGSSPYGDSMTSLFRCDALRGEEAEYAHDDELHTADGCDCRLHAH